jgi:hypothetical protein
LRGWGDRLSPSMDRNEGDSMHTVSDIVMDISRGCAANNMIEICFSYRIVYFVNENGKGTKFYIDTLFDGLRAALESIVKENLTATNSIVISAVTTRKAEGTVSLLSRSYGFSLNEYFQKICEAKEKEYIGSNYGRRKMQWG